MNTEGYILISLGIGFGAGFALGRLTRNKKDIPPEEEYEDLRKRYTKEVKHENVDAFFAKPSDIAKDIIDMETYLASMEIPSEEPEEERMHGTPHSISSDIYYSNETNKYWDYDRVVLNYYDRDRVLCTETEDVINNPDDVLGPGALNRFGDEKEDPDTIHICDDKIKTMYEVVRIHESFHKVVMGSQKELGWTGDEEDDDE